MKTFSLLLLSAILGLTSINAQKHTEAKKKPNIIFIFTDDQDHKLDSLKYMPNVQKYLVEEGTVYENHYATIAVCCPSRVGLLRGQYAHNTNITDVSPPYGGYERFNTLKLGEDYLPIWLQKSGYNTNYIGKLMNQYSVNNYNNPTPRGFDHQDQLVDPYTYVYNSAVFSVNGEPPVYYKDAYQTDVVHAKTRAALKRVQAQEDPFFLWVAPMAPHGQFEVGENGVMKTSDPIPAARHAHLFKDVKVPRTPHFNPDQQVKTASYWKTLEKLNATLVEALDETYRNRLRALQSVDEIVGTIFEELEKSGELDNTFVFYSADNGYHLGQHRAYPGKCTNLEEDINVPLLVRGPSIGKGKVSQVVSAHHDLAPTFVAIAGGDEYLPSWVDGGVMPLTKELAKHRKPISKESFSVEFWNSRLFAENYNIGFEGPNTYKTLRVISEDYNYMYSVWCTGEHEFYNLKNDPYEMKNLYTNVNSQIINRLDALLVVLKSCRAETCRDPWRILHPNDKNVKTLKDALHKKYNAHYSQFRKIQFEECLNFYAAANETPVIGQHFTANITETLPQKITQQHFQRRLKDNANQDNKVIIPKEYHKLMRLVPEPKQAVGQNIPGEDFEKDATPVDTKLLENPVNWAEYNFYGFGN